ncbi:hypothetical protein LAZ67_19000180 [Cordylochernes scorpioides]|uniref:MAM domain-containing protein n=1 Tax=Cordylochernes scorpioides TaxID=51811 RepID=A0ABY6LIF5_9ARAC|nr:hypothetical protein LAZ67_19000180 [Cordylochernes scorpioides]
MRADRDVTAVWWPQKTREKRQDSDDYPSPNCDFEESPPNELCSWTNGGNTTRFQWQRGQGDVAIWQGGTLEDSKGDIVGYYAYFETSYEGLEAALQQVGDGDDGVTPPGDVKPPETALLISPNISGTPKLGTCLTFQYAMDGLSADRLRVLVQLPGRTDLLWETGESTQGLWRKGQLLYTATSDHMVMFEGVPKKVSDPVRAYRGYVALDDFDFGEPGAEDCQGHCTFEGGFCEWKNIEEDDFDWQMGRGSQNTLTGPAKDFSSFGRDIQAGGYIYIDSAFPRRPGDVARLVSPEFQPTGDNNPVCLKFATHMFGNGVGVLRVILREGETEKVIWEISGDAGNNWYTAQVPVYSPTTYELIMEGVVGANHLGNIAVDNVSFREGACPIYPQAASFNSGDCTFEENTCGWNNVYPVDGVDDFDWTRQYSYTVNDPAGDHTKADSEGYYMSLLSSALLPQRGLTRAWLVSPQFSGLGEGRFRCVTFFYYMHERTVDPAGPSLGGIRVYVRPAGGSEPRPMTPIWRLSNHQGRRWLQAKASVKMGGSDRTSPRDPYEVVIEGVWGQGRAGFLAIDDISFFDGDCSAQPVQAASVYGECFFERDMCGWTNLSREDSGPGVTDQRRPEMPPRRLRGRDEALTWRLATVTNRPANIQDHTFRALTGFVFFDVFNQLSVQTPVLQSPPLVGIENDQCLSFWFAPYGRGDSIALSVRLVDRSDPEEERPAVIWRVNYGRFDGGRADWQYGQITLKSESDYVVRFEGEAADGGFALDDITFFEGSCSIRPSSASMVVEEEGEERRRRKKKKR